MARRGSISMWDGRKAGCPRCGALRGFPCVSVDPEKLRELERARQYKPGGPLPDLEHIHPERAKYVIATKAA
jgi:hypothetical protein